MKQFPGSERTTFDFVMFAKPRPHSLACNSYQILNVDVDALIEAAYDITHFAHEWRVWLGKIMEMYGTANPGMTF